MSSLPTRQHALRALGAAEFDLLVVGGGIVGAGVARDAARRGLRVALVEQLDFASGTSSRSSRLVHGGVRYLEHGWLHLVFEASRERRRLLDTAPHLVRPLRFTWPVYEQQRLARWEIGAGLMMYDVLALYRNVGKHRRLSRRGVLEREPALRPEALRGGATYWDAATHDARLTLVTALDAERAGARIVNHARVVAFHASAGRVRGARVRDMLTGAEIDVRARAIVNATGPWTDSVRKLESPEAPDAVLGTKGVHLLVPSDRIGNHGAITLLHPADQRVMFTLPAGRFTILGTTDTRTGAHPDDVRADQSDVRYLLGAANHFFPAASLTESDVVTAWAGIRPLVVPAAGSAPPGNQSREHEIAVGPGGVIGVSGGKLTTYRAMAEEIVDVAADRIGRKGTRSDTARTPLPGGALSSVEEEIATASEICGDPGIAGHLVAWYGSEWRGVWALGEARPELRARIVPGNDAIAAQVVHAVRTEHALTLDDVLVRRTQIAFETRDHGVSVAARVADLVAADLGWSADARQRAVARYTADVQRLFGVDEPTGSPG